MRTYTATIKNTQYGGTMDVAIMAESYNQALVQAQALYGSLVVYVQS